METIQVLGSLGEFVGAIAVVATLIYLTIQVRHSKEAMDANTRSMEESRRLAIAQAYQARTAMHQDALLRAMDSPYMPAIHLKVEESGLEALTAEERWRLRRSSAAGFDRIDNIHFQYRQGFIEETFWRAFREVAKRQAPLWRDLGMSLGVRPDFHEEVERLLAEEEQS